MRTRPRQHPQKRGASALPSAPHSGATLTEVLISMMIMGIGIVSLATLFPISVLRSIQATQLTNATMLRYNAEALMDLNPNILSPRRTSASAPTPPLFTRIRSRKYVVDPLGALQVGGPFCGEIERADLGALNPALTDPAAFVDRIVTLPDSYTEYYQDIPASVNAFSVTMPADVDLTDVPVTTSGLSRLVIFNDLKTRSVTRDIVSRSGQTLGWDNSDPQNQLPADIQSAPGEVRIEFEERRYTWLLNVRRSGKRANVDVVVFFGRQGTPQEEQRYTGNFRRSDPAGPSPDPIRLGADAQPGDAGVDDDINGTVDDTSEIGWPGTDDNRTVWGVTWTGEQPPVEKGGFVFDVFGARWYRIQDVVERTAGLPGWAQGTALVLERDIATQTPSARIGQPVNTAFMNSVVDVFPIGTKTLP